LVIKMAKQKGMKRWIVGTTLVGGFYGGERHTTTSTT